MTAATICARTPLFGQVAPADGLTTGARRYLRADSTGIPGSTLNATGTFIVPCAGTISRLYAEVATADSLGQSRTFVVMAGSSIAGMTDTAITCTLATGVASGSDLSHSISVAAGDCITISTYASGTTSGTGWIALGLLFEADPSVSGSSFVSGTIVSPSVSVTEYAQALGYQGSPATTSTTFYTPWSITGVLKNFRIAASASPGVSPKAETFTLVRVRSGTETDTGITVTVDATNYQMATPSGSPTETTQAGDAYFWKCAPTSTPTARTFTWSMEFVPDTVALSLHGSAGAAGFSTTTGASSFLLPHGYAGQVGTTNYRASKLSINARVVRAFGRVFTAPGANKQWEFGLIASGGSRSIQNTIVGTATESAGRDALVQLVLTQGSLVNLEGGATGGNASLTVGAAFMIGLYVIPKITIGYTDETDTGLALGRKHVRALGLAEETDAGLTITRAAAAHAVTTAVETDAGLALGQRKVVALGTAVETEIGLDLARSHRRAITTSTETDAGLALAPVKRLALGLAAESDTGLLVGIQAGFNPAVETDVALPLVVRKVRPITGATETEVGLTVTAHKARSLTTATETNEAVALGRTKAFVLAPSVEIDTSLPVRSLKAYPLGTTDETDTANPISLVHHLGTAVETDTANPIILSDLFGTANEYDTALPITATLIVLPPLHARRTHTLKVGANTTSTSKVGTGVFSTARDGNGHTSTAIREDVR